MTRKSKWENSRTAHREMPSGINLNVAQHGRHFEWSCHAPGTLHTDSTGTSTTMRGAKSAAERAARRLAREAK